MNRLVKLSGAFCIAVIILIAINAIARATEYEAPNVSEYYTTLMQVDNPRTSCCGEADRYYADKVDECRPTDVVVNGSGRCALVAIITDTGPDIFTLADGRVIRREHIEPGTRIVVPTTKIRRPASANPTEHNILFLNKYLFVYCWEPATGI